MLRQLSIKNFAIVDSATMEFAPGFNVLTGETGAGKSLIVDALYFLLGDRIGPGMLRVGEERAVVEALFQVPETDSTGSPRKSAAVQKLSEWGIDAPSGEILVKREYVKSSAKTRSFLNGEMATAAMIAELGAFLIDIHGQHEHQAIFNLGAHRKLVDSFGHLEKALQKTSEAYQTLSRLREEQVRLGGDSKEIARRADLLQFQAREIEDFNLAGLNEEELLQRYQLLKHAGKIRTQVTEAQAILDEEGEGGVTGRFGIAVARLRDGAKLDPKLEKLVETALSLQEGLNQLSFELAQKIEGYSFSDSEFDELSDRIDGLNGMKKKYGDTAADILSYHGKIKEELATLLGREGRLRVLGQEMDLATEKYRMAASQLSTKRFQTGKELASQVQSSLKELGLPHAQLEVSVEPQLEEGSPVSENGKSMALSPLGWDRVEFLFSANPGEPLRPLVKVASGGEASRVMLALKTVLAGNDETPTLIFDEIDTGVGARTASAVAVLLRRLATEKQVLCISHLAPIAGLGDCHYLVSKSFAEGETEIRVHRLTEEQRVEELAKMLGGEPVSETSRSHAKELYARMRGV